MCIKASPNLKILCLFKENKNENEKKDPRNQNIVNNGLNCKHKKLLK